MSGAALRLGILGCDTSHVVAFTERLHGVGVEPDQMVEGAHVVAAWPGESAIAADRLPGYVQALRGLGVVIVDRPSDLSAHGVDAVLVEAQQGSVHSGLALPWLRAGIPVFVDKPFVATAADASAMVEAAAAAGAPLLSASALRFCDELAALAVGPVLGADTYSPAALHPLNPGLLHYGVHGVELLYAMLGPGCRRVSCVQTPGADAARGEWGDGRLGTVRGLRAGATGYGFSAFGRDGLTTAAVSTRNIYRNLLRVVVGVLSGGPSPVSPSELVEVVAFQECALRSAGQGGAAVSLSGI